MRPRVGVLPFEYGALQLLDRTIGPYKSTGEKIQMVGEGRARKNSGKLTWQVENRILTRDLHREILMFCYQRFLLRLDLVVALVKLALLLSSLDSPLLL